ncbi:MAG: L-lactate permease [Anaerolineaceae bacterium]|nr:L-lactate permease [Anaerolineaceae bacterium]
MELSLLNWFLAILPVITILILMMWRGWGGSKSGAAAWFITLLIAGLRFGAGFEILAFAQVKAVMLALDVLWIIWNALFLFHLTREAGAVDSIGSVLTSLTSDRTMQGLLLGWLFPSFLQGLGGFGVPVAVSAPLLVGVGFSPLQAVIMASIGHGWAVTYGSLASSFQTLIAVSGLPGEILAPQSALLLWLAAYLCGMIVALLAGGLKGLRRTLLPIFLIGTVMGFTQYLLSTNGLWTLAATLAGMVGLLLGVVLTRLPAYKNPNGSQHKAKSVLVSFSSYLILIILAFGINLIPPVKAFLGQASFSLDFPELSTARGWVVPASSGRVIHFFTHPGSILLYSSLLSYLLYRRMGLYKNGSLKRIGERVLNGAVKSSLGIVAMVALSIVMADSGMTYLLAEGISRNVGALVYPLIVPFIGALGAFITGSNNNSNVLFAVLQMNTAEMLGLTTTLILAAQTAGGALGSVLAPAKVIVGCSTVGLGGQEGTVMKKMLLYGLAPVLVVALAAAVWQMLV